MARTVSLHPVVRFMYYEDLARRLKIQYCIGALDGTGLSRYISDCFRIKHNMYISNNTHSNILIGTLSHKAETTPAVLLFRYC